MTETYCSHNEDKEILETFSSGKGGYFVDIGANDGVTGSNSYLLEKNGWQGLLVEPNPSLVDELKKIRSSSIVPYLVSDQMGEVTFHIVSGPGNLHGLSRIDATPEFFDHIKKHGGEVTEKKVLCKGLTTILDENNAPENLEFLSIDVEGHELAVLETLDFSKYHPQIIMLEDNSKGFDKGPMLFLKEKGYERVHRTGVNDWYTKDLKNRFFFKRLRSQFTFLRWDLKRSMYRLLNKELKNELI